MKLWKSIKRGINKGGHHKDLKMERRILEDGLKGYFIFNFLTVLVKHETVPVNVQV